MHCIGQTNTKYTNLLNGIESLPTICPLFRLDFNTSYILILTIMLFLTLTVTLEPIFRLDVIRFPRPAVERWVKQLMREKCKFAVRHLGT